jgi:hypothetical protein
MPGNWGFCGPTYVSQSPNVDDEDAMNCYCEQSGSPNAKTPIALLHTPGRKIFASLAGESSVPSIFFLNGRCFAASSHLYELNASGNVIANYGSLGAAPTRPTMMTANQIQLAILNNGNLFVLTFLGAITAAIIHAGAAGTGYAIGDTGTINGTGATYQVTGTGGGGTVTSFIFTPGSGNVAGNDVATAVLTGSGDGTFAVDVTAVANNSLYQVVASQFNGPINQIGFLDGYVVATIQNSHTFQQSNLEDATVWNGLNIATLSYFPDNIVSMSCYARVIKFSSGKKSVWYYNGGAGFPVFIPIQGAFFEGGSCAAFADSVTANNTAVWLSQDDRGSLVAMLSNGFAGQRISTHAVELAWQSYATTSDAVTWSYQEYGHTQIIFDFPTAGTSWGYDMLTGYWHKRAFWVRANGTYIMDRAICHALAFGIHLVGDWASGNIYQLSSQFCTDFGNAIRGYRRSPTLSIANKKVYFSEIEFDAEVGLGVSVVDAALWLAVQGVLPLIDGDGNARPPQLMLRWSDNAGKTWSNTYFLNVGSVGNYDARVIKRMLGAARKRVWEVSWTDPIPWRFADAYVTAEPQSR